jgi:hypothetical protein
MIKINLNIQYNKIINIIDFLHSNNMHNVDEIAPIILLV